MDVYIFFTFLCVSKFYYVVRSTFAINSLLCEQIIIRNI